MWRRRLWRAEARAGGGDVVRCPLQVVERRPLVVTPCLPLVALVVAQRLRADPAVILARIIEGEWG